MTTLRERLAERYPTWWGRCIGIEVPDGWEPLVERLCADIAVALGPRAEQLRVRQVKEKLAELIVYWDHPDVRGPGCGVEIIENAGGVLMRPRHAGDEIVQSLVDAATTASHTTCQECTAAAALSSNGGCLARLCAEHREALGFKLVEGTSNP